jgi:hypothetical protein
MAESVAVAEAKERRSEEATEVIAPHGVPGIVGGELLAAHELGLWDRAHRTHVTTVSA